MKQMKNKSSLCNRYHFLNVMLWNVHSIFLVSFITSCKYTCIVDKKLCFPYISCPSSIYPIMIGDFLYNVGGPIYMVPVNWGEMDIFDPSCVSKMFKSL